MMEICGKDHDEIVFNAKGCPLCEIKSQLHDVENELSKAQNEIADLERVFFLRQQPAHQP